MSSLHEQAMQSIYQQVLDRVCSHMSRGQQTSLQLLIQRLTIAAGGLQHIGQFQVLVVQGGDRCSAHLLACLRAAQLSLAIRDGRTFRLRVMVCCLPTLASETLMAHERIFDVLFMQDDPRVDLLMLEDDKVVPFCSRPLQAMQPWMGAREALLMFGHLTEATPEALLGCRLHLQLADALRLAVDWGGGASALVTALPDRQRRRFIAWGRRVLRLAGERGLDEVHQCAAALAESLGRLQTWVGVPLGRSIGVPAAVAREQPVQIVAINDLLCPQTQAHQLDAMLDQETLAVPGTPLATWTDPSLVANLSRLHAHLFTRYARRLDSRLPPKDMHTGWWLSAQQQGREQFRQALGVDEAQLTCLLLAPFAEQGRNLAQFLQGCHPRMRVAQPYLHKALQGKPCPEAIKRWLVEVSGLSLTQLQVIYSGRLDAPTRQLLENLARRDAALHWLPPASAPAMVRQAAF